MRRLLSSLTSGRGSRLAAPDQPRKRVESEHRHLKVHWHVAVTYPACEDGYHERVFKDLHLALDWANEMRRSLLNMAYESSTEVTDGRDRKEGVIRRYYVSESTAQRSRSLRSVLVLTRVTSDQAPRPAADRYLGQSGSSVLKGRSAAPRNRVVHTTNLGPAPSRLCRPPSPAAVAKPAGGITA